MDDVFTQMGFPTTSQVSELALKSCPWVRNHMSNHMTDVRVYILMSRQYHHQLSKLTLTYTYFLYLPKLALVYR